MVSEGCALPEGGQVSGAVWESPLHSVSPTEADSVSSAWASITYHRLQLKQLRCLLVVLEAGSPSQGSNSWF